MAKGLQLLAWVLVAIIAMMVVGCARHTIYVPLEPPVTQPETSLQQEATLMEEYQEVTRLYEAEKTRALALETKLAEETLTRENVETEAQALKKRVDTLEADLLAKAELEQRYTEAREELLQLSKTVPELQRKLLNEQLARIRHEQTIVTLKIEGAMERRKRMLEAGLGTTEMTSYDSDVKKESDDANL